MLGEFRYGIALSRHRSAYQGWLDAHIPAFEVLTVTDATASVYAEMSVGLRRQADQAPAGPAPANPACSGPGPDQSLNSSGASSRRLRRQDCHSWAVSGET